MLTAAELRGARCALVSTEGVEPSENPGLSRVRMPSSVTQTHHIQ